MAKSFIGTVSSDRADKTIVVTVRTRKTHPIYKKQYTVSKKFMAHDEANEARIGDKVSIRETKPLSARKRFALRKVLERAAIRHVESNDSLSSVVSPQSPARDQKTRGRRLRNRRPSHDFPGITP